MNQTIRKRIEDINNGIVPEGYKQTPFGIFPCDWETDKEFVDFCEINPRTGKLDEEFVYIDLESVVDGKLIQKNIIRLCDAPSRAQRVLSENDVLYQMVRPYQKNNFIFQHNEWEIQTVASTGYAQLRNDNPTFLYQLINSEHFCAQVVTKCTGTNYPAINSEDLGKVVVSFPKDKTEQGKIAEILMKWDEAIELQEQYIQKLELRKKAYIDKFFTEKSCNCVFKDLYVQSGEGGTPDTKKVEYYENGNIPFVKIEHLYEKYIDEIDSFITGEGLKKSGAWLVPENSLIFSNGATIGECSINRIPVATKQGILGIVHSEKLELEYFYYLLKSVYFLNKIKKITTKGTMCTAYLKDIDKLKLYIHSKAEQSAISKLLGKVDEEISLQKEKLAKIKEQRKAMQQYLLTGVVRVG